MKFPFRIRSLYFVLFELETKLRSIYALSTLHSTKKIERPVKGDRYVLAPATRVQHNLSTEN